MIALYIVLALAIALAIFVATRPATFRLERSTIINAGPDKIQPLVADFRKWTLWSPFDRLDPDQTRTYSGAPSGEGSIYDWESKGKAGAGHMEMLEASISRVLIQLDFSNPFVAHNLADFTFEPQGAATRVTWAMYGPNTTMSKLMSLVFNMDKVVGKDFESGLAAIKVEAEKP